MRVKALQKVFYDGRDREIGEEFETLDDLHGRVLMVSGRVAKAENDSNPRNTAHPSAAINRGRYKRRDLRADE